MFCLVCLYLPKFAENLPRLLFCLTSLALLAALLLLHLPYRDKKLGRMGHIVQHAIAPLEFFNLTPQGRLCSVRRG
jgi:hypothetical protein